MGTPGEREKMSRNKTLVVAHYNEDLRWTKDVDAEIHIVQKGDKPNCEYDYLLRAGNVGREPHSYLLYIVKHYDDLKGVYTFTQGDPFDHHPDFVTEVNKGLEGNFKWIATDPTKFKIANPDGSPHDGDMNIHAMHRVFYDGPLPKTYPFHPACLFMVTAERLHRYPLETYETLLKVMPYKRNPWAFERLVGHLWADVV